jgi:polyisoprenoid-binding protein YceI
MRSTNLVFATAVAVAVLSGPLSAQAQTWTIDPNHTAAQFAVRHLVVSTVRGQFEKTSGTITWDGKDVRTVQVQVTIDVASVNTRVKMRDDDLRSDNFFDVARFPIITFTSKSVEVVDATRFKLTGALTMHGVTRDVVLDVEGPSPPIRQGPMLRTGATATTKINRHDFGLTYSRVMEGVPIVGDDVTITIDIEATRRDG